MKTTFSILVLAALAGSAQATITAVPLGAGGTAGSRGSSLGSYSLAQVPSTGLLFSDISSLSTPIGTLGFSQGMNVRQIGSGWSTWSGGYTGEVYYSNGSGSVDMALPAGTGAFAFYAEPNPFEVWTITAKDNEGNVISQDIDGSGGAAGFGFYTDGSSSLTSINVSSGTDFAVGEMWIAAVPAPSSLALLGLGGLIAGRRRR